MTSDTIGKYIKDSAKMSHKTFRYLSANMSSRSNMISDEIFAQTSMLFDQLVREVREGATSDAIAMKVK